MDVETKTFSLKGKSYIFRLSNPYISTKIHEITALRAKGRIKKRNWPFPLAFHGAEGKKSYI
jgi:hypothetical protein